MMLVSYRRAENSGRINFFSKNKIAFLANITCSKSAIKTIEKGVKYVQS